MQKNTFLDSFPNHIYRYIDQTGEGRPAFSVAEIKTELNKNGYESYFTVNGFADANKATKENLINLNAFFVDIDGRKDADEIERIKVKLEPTYIIETMRGYHIYWILDEAIYKDECFGDQWDELVSKWEAIEETIVEYLKADPVVKDTTRIMRVPGTYYWKKSKDAWKKGVANAPFKIKGIHKNLAKTYSMDQMLEAFPLSEKKNDKLEQMTYKSKGDAADFFAKVNKFFPLETRDSYIAITSGKKDKFILEHGRNQVLVIAASLMREAGVPMQECHSTILATGWHGMVAERGGKEEIKTTILSAYKGGYTYGKNNIVVAHFMTSEEHSKLQVAYSLATKERKEKDQVRFHSYERIMAEKFPNVRVNEVGMIFVYENGVYREAEENWMMNRILESMEEDALFGYRTRNHVKDKIACWVSLMPLFVLNENPVILNVKNGLLNIKTRQLIAHTPAYVSLYQMPVEYDPNATCPTWLKSLHSWTTGDDEEDKTKMLQQFAGYCLTDSTKHAKMLILVGDGGNGKSTFADTISMMVGKKGTSHISLETLEKNFGAGELLGKRLNIVEEISGNFYHSHILKKIISGEEVTTDKKYFAHFTFKPTAKFIFAVNEMPRVDDSSQATERRMLVCMFNNNFRQNPDTSLRFEDGLLAKELSGILNWAVEGWKSLEEEGFIITEEQEKAIKEYRQENSSGDAFVDECLVFSEGDSVESSDMYDKYLIYCKKSGLKAWSRIRLTKHLKMMGIRTKKFSYYERSNNHATSNYEGLKFNIQWEGLTLNADMHVVDSRTLNEF